MFVAGGKIARRCPQVHVWNRGGERLDRFWEESIVLIHHAVMMEGVNIIKILVLECMRKTYATSFSTPYAD